MVLNTKIVRDSIEAVHDASPLVDANQILESRDISELFKGAKEHGWTGEIPEENIEN